MATCKKNTQYKSSCFICLIVGFVLSLLMSSVGAVEKITYNHNDALGSPVAATDEAGNLLWREAYQPYGERLLKQGDATNSTWFTGKQEDKASGLSYFHARWYDPEVGRFTAIDPVDFQEVNIHSFNRYAYANNNPYKFIDPDENLPLPALAIWIPDVGEAIGASAALIHGTVTGDKHLMASAGQGLGLTALGAVTGINKVKNVGKAAKTVISKQKQAGHIPGTPQNANRIKQGKPTSSFFGEKSGEYLTKKAFEKGKLVLGRPNMREYDFGVSTGTGPNGGMQSRVRVHQDSKGQIHGHPSGPERFK